jgi:hypothetical protein
MNSLNINIINFISILLREHYNGFIFMGGDVFIPITLYHYSFLPLIKLLINFLITNEIDVNE